MVTGIAYYVSAFLWMILAFCTYNFTTTEKYNERKVGNLLERHRP